MNVESFNLAGLAKYLHRDARDLEKLASRGRLPGRRVGGDWIFKRDEVVEWLERELSGLSDSQLEDVEVGVRGAPAGRELDLLVSELLQEDAIAIPLEARTAPKVLERLVELANHAWQVYMPDEALAAVRAREQLWSTALPGGVAIPHPRRPLGDAIGEPIIALGRTSSAIPFGSKGETVDLFFLVLCQTDRMHLQVLARLSRMFQRERFLDQLREAATPREALAVIRQCEEEVLK